MLKLSGERICQKFAKILEKDVMFRLRTSSERHGIHSFIEILDNTVSIHSQRHNNHAWNRNGAFDNSDALKKAAGLNNDFRRALAWGKETGPIINGGVRPPVAMRADDADGILTRYLPRLCLLYCY